jgi:hypothetical protein
VKIDDSRHEAKSGVSRATLVVPARMDHRDLCGLLGASIFLAVVRSMMSDEPLGCCLALFVAGLPGVGLVLSMMAGLSLEFSQGCC